MEKKNNTKKKIDIDKKMIFSWKVYLLKRFVLANDFDLGTSTVNQGKSYYGILYQAKEYENICCNRIYRQISKLY